LLSVCPECKQQTFGKMLTAAGFQLKGGGWYATDFKHSGEKPGAKTAGQSGTASKTETTGQSKSEGKSESQPAAAAAPAAPAAPASTAKAE
jgi:hypothetical protein